eukprot:732462-Pelagomonas_calceolata.AAC.3
MGHDGDGGTDGIGVQKAAVLGHSADERWAAVWGHSADERWVFQAQELPSMGHDGVVVLMLCRGMALMKGEHAPASSPVVGRLTL